MVVGNSTLAVKMILRMQSEMAVESFTHCDDQMAVRENLSIYCGLKTPEVMYSAAPEDGLSVVQFCFFFFLPDCFLPIIRRTGFYFINFKR